MPFPAPPAPASYPAAPAASYPAAPAAASFPPASFPPASFPAAPGVAGFPVDPAAAYPVNPTNGGFAAGVGYPPPAGYPAAQGYPDPRQGAHNAVPGHVGAPYAEPVQAPNGGFVRPEAPAAYAAPAAPRYDEQGGRYDALAGGGYRAPAETEVPLQRHMFTPPVEPAPWRDTSFAEVPAPAPAPPVSGPGPQPGVPAPGSRSNWPLVPRDDDDMAVRQPAAYPNAYPSLEAEDSGQFSLTFDVDPLDRAAPARPTYDDRVPPPWLADDLQSDPPVLRLVDSPDYGETPTPDPLTDPLQTDSTGEMRFGPPQLRVIDNNGSRTAGGGRSRRTSQERMAPINSAPAGAEADGDLLIFSQTRSAWFTHLDEDEPREAEQLAWTSVADEGWRAAEQASRPAVGDETMAGLPRRVPQANLVPGSPATQSRPLRIVRDAASIAEHTTGYFRGWRRGQEIGGFAVGQRDRGAWDFNREQRSREGRDHADQRTRRP
ncbi:hypothetical protein GCM10009682_53950 [Luedemannella flava]|uniref:Uncharacterized protein n=1 Tax=Luedemannella flava TaxID=349316 RepID=A0ABN2MKQ9_9ACTN